MFPPYYSNIELFVTIGRKYFNFVLTLEETLVLFRDKDGYYESFTTILLPTNTKSSSSFNTGWCYQPALKWTL